MKMAEFWCSDCGKALIFYRSLDRQLLLGQ